MKNIETELAAIMGMSDLNIPYINQQIIPISINNSIERDRSFVWRDFIAFMDCGRNANVVPAAPINPNINIGSNYKLNFSFR